MATLNRNHIQQRFNRYAVSYDEYAVIYKAMADSLLERLALVKLEPKIIIDLGCGTGYLTVQLAKRYPEAKVIGIDAAVNMLQVARQKDSTIDYDQAWAEQLPLSSASVDLVVSNALLPWCNDLLAAFYEVNRVLKPEGLFLFTSFGPDSLQALRQAWARIDVGAHVHGFLDMHDVGDRLLAAGLTDPVMDAEFVELTYASIESCLNDLRLTGSGNVLAGREKGLLGKDKFNQFENNFQQQFSPNKKLALSYEVIHGHAWQGKLQLADVGEQSIDLSQLRRFLTG